jgi:hypothetical protein
MAAIAMPDTKDAIRFFIESLNSILLLLEFGLSDLDYKRFGDKKSRAQRRTALDERHPLPAHPKINRMRYW